MSRVGGTENKYRFPTRWQVDINTYSSQRAGERRPQLSCPLPKYLSMHHLFIRSDAQALGTTS